jgi:hypothetical protein
MKRQAMIAVVLVCVLAWCCLLFGIGLDDLTNDHTKPGVIFSIAVLVLLIGGILYALYRLVAPTIRKRFARNP